MIRAGWFMGTLAMLASEAAAVEPRDIIECRSDMATFQSFAEGALEGRPPAGWTKIDGGNPFLTEFRVARPITAFGRQTSRVAFASSGLLALFEKVSAADVAKPLGITNDYGSRSKFLGEKILSRSVEHDEASKSRFTTIVALSVSTVDTHPEVVLAGCSYRVDVESL